MPLAFRVQQRQGIPCKIALGLTPWWGTEVLNTLKEGEFWDLW